MSRMSFYRRYGKRIFDLCLVVPGLILASPLILYVALRSLVLIGSPVLFTQPRPGLKGKVFKMVKFRSMRNDRGADGELLPDHIRLVPWGRKLRDSSLDVLPELWNVLLGQMSLVGPRPLLVSYLERYNGEQMRRHEVLPGITGYAQVNGRNTISWEEKFAHDVWYVDNVSLGLDIKILFMTFQKVFKRSDISADGHATMPEFMGTTSEKR